MADPTLYLAHTGVDLDAAVEGPWEAAVRLAPGLLLLDSTAGRSAVYHALKDHVPRGTALVVAPLADAPKMAHVAPGATAWARAHRPR